MQKTAIVLGGQGLVGLHIVKRLKDEGYWVRSVDTRRRHKFRPDHLFLCDLRDPKNVSMAFEYPEKLKVDHYNTFDEVYNLASDTELANYNIDRLLNSNAININVLRQCILTPVSKLFYASGSNIHPIFEHFLNDNIIDGYKKEKTYCEYLYESAINEYGLNARIGRYNNIFGPMCNYENYEESVVIGICNKIIKCKDGASIKIKLSQDHLVSCLYVDDCIDQTISLMRSDNKKALDIQSESKITIENLVSYIVKLSNKQITVIYDDSESSNHSDFIIDTRLAEQIKITYDWIDEEIKKTFS